MQVAALLFALLLCLVPGVARAQGIDCAKHLQTAQGAIDKVTEDMKGMETMPKDQLLYVQTLLDDAKMLLDGARHNCEQPRADYDRARAIAKAEAARGSAEAADVLHWHFMKTGHGMKPSSGTPGMSMPGMKK
jgi:hypothetical protein